MMGDDASDPNSTVGLEASNSEVISSPIEDSSTGTDVSGAYLIVDEDAKESQKKEKKKKWQDRFVDVDLDAPGGPSPIDNKKNIFSIFTYWWAGSILAKGYKRPLSAADVWNLPIKEDTEKNASKLQQEWDKEMQRDKKKKSFFAPFFRASRTDTVLSALFMLLYCGLALFGPAYLLKQLVLFIQNRDTKPVYEGWLYVVGLFLQSLLQVTFVHYHFYLTVRIGIRMRAGMMMMIYRKAIRVGTVDSTMGEILNLQANDSYRIAEYFRFFHFFWATPVLCIGVYLLVIFEIGIIPASVGFAALVLLFPIQMVSARKISAQRAATVKVTDQRVRLMSEILNAIRVVKLYCWEQSFADRVTDIRDQEVEGLRFIGMIKSLNQSVSLVGPALVSFVTFLTMIALNQELTASVAFTVLSLYNVARYPLSTLPLSIKAYAESKIALGRLHAFLRQQEQPDYRQIVTDNPKKSITIKGRFNWHGAIPMLLPRFRNSKVKVLTVAEMNKQSGALRKIDLKVRAGEIVAVVGGVGAGKTSLLQAMLGQMRLMEGSVKVKGTTAYVSQQSWLMSDTIKNNILFGLPYDKDRYLRVLELCQLLPDLAGFPALDQTEVGEKGVSLSGGQRQRFALARAVYANSDIYLFDDPLSAVDSQVGRELFENLFRGYLRSKAIVFVNNQIQFLPRCDRIVYMKSGEIQAVGSYDDLLYTCPDFAQMVNDHIKSISEEAEKKEGKKEGVQMSPRRQSKLKRRPQMQHINYVLSRQVFRDLDTKDPKELMALGKRVTAEERQLGGVSARLFSDYAKAGNAGLCAMLLIYFIIVQAARVINDWYLSYWISNPIAELRTLYWFGVIMGAILLGFIVVTVTRAILFAYFTIGASTKLHNGVFEKVLRAPVSFFDSTPTGRILNRFSKDQDQVDDLLPDALLQALQYNLIVLSTLILIAVLLPWFTICLVPFGVLFWFIGAYYRRSSRELKRMDSITRSPIVEHLSATLQGLHIIRAFQAVERFEGIEVQRINNNHRFLFAFEMASRWLAYRLDVMSTFVVALTGVFILVLQDQITPSAAGLALSYALQLSQVFQWSVRMTAETESLMTSVERLVHYTRTLDSEAPRIIEDNRPPKDWPTEGNITYRGVEVKYKSTGPAALNNINFSVKSKEKIGIVGRTGAGKSTLGMTLFRIMEPTSGSIIIDGVDITEIGLDDLRSRLAIIPQEPVLFTGTIRFNLDPFDQYTDREIWDALDRVQMKKTVLEYPEKLNALVKENGDNFSVGQRQLICIARAIVRKPKILVLDEATAAMDIETDKLVQQTIRQCFGNCTVLTVAHRLYTIIDSTKIMVMDKGKIVEYDSPKELLIKRGNFSRLIDETGEQAAKFLRDVAMGRLEIYEIPTAVSRESMKHVRRQSDLKKEKMYKKIIKENSRLMITNTPKEPEIDSYQIISFISNSPRSSRRLSSQIV